MFLAPLLPSFALAATLLASGEVAPAALLWSTAIAAEVQPTPEPAPSPRRAPRAPRAEPAEPAAAGQAPVQARPGGPESDAPKTDQTVDVAKGTRLVLTNQAGEVRVRAWDRDAVRVQASHSSRERVELQTADNTLRVRARSARGPAGLIDFTLTVPRWMAVNLSGTYLAANIEGTSAEVNVETVGGDLTLKGGSGTVSLRSIQGEIHVDGASGKLQATTVNDSISLTNVSGDVVAETTNGDITIIGAKAASLEVSTVSGDVRFEGPTADKGTYRITTHNGDIRVSLGSQPNATVFVRTFGGDFDSDFPITLPEGMSRRGNKRFNFTLGSGSARVELESFQGDIRVTKGPLVTRENERKRRGADARAPRPDALAWLDHTIDQNVERTIEQTLEHVFESLDQIELNGGHSGLMETPPTPPTPLTPPAPPAPPAPPTPLVTPSLVPRVPPTPLAPPAPLSPPRPPAPLPDGQR